MRLLYRRCPGALLAGLLLVPAAAFATDVVVRTPLGDFEIELLNDAAPATVTNFLKYVSDGDFNDSFIHRSEPGFVIQGGGYTWTGGQPVAVPTDPPVVNEFGASNTRGTVAMAKLGSDPNSATSQWFVNLADNSANLDAQNGGFTVFGRVKGNGMQVVDAIAALQRWNAGTAFSTLPLIDFTQGETIATRHLVLTQVVADTDGDGVYDDVDLFPADPLESTDNDADGTGDNGDSDDDNDSLPDSYEVDSGLDPFLDDADQDADTDGLNNLEEYQAGTSPIDADTDGDGVYDGVDLFPANPLESTDNDADGTGDNGDSDDDNDSLPDSYEVDSGLDPFLDDADQDADADGLNNLEEYQAGTSPVDADTDGDGLEDGAELFAGRDPLLNESAVILLINSMDE